MRLLQAFAWLTIGAFALQVNASRRRPVTAGMPDRDVNERPQGHHEDLDSYQALLDESLQLTFPASDPVCAHAATRCADPRETPANPVDWQLHAGSEAAAGAAPRP